jgi:hypothetical protein
MIQIDARRNVAGVHNDHAFGNLTMFLHPNQTMRVHDFSRDIQHAMPKRLSCALPNVALIHACILTSKVKIL